MESIGCYQEIKELGSGAYSKVYGGVHPDSKETVALKKLHYEPMFILRELRTMQTLHHPNLLRCLHIIQHQLDYYLVTPRFDTNLGRVIHSKQVLTLGHIRHFMYQILHGLSFMHRSGFIHRDIKPDNVLVNNNCDTVICDFGMARRFGGDFDKECDLTDYVVTRWYRPPEVLLTSGHYNEKVDIWSAGCILAEFALRAPLLPGRDANHQLELIIDLLGTTAAARTLSQSQLKLMPQCKTRDFSRLFGHILNDQAIDLLRHMLLFDPKERISATTALEHPFFADMLPIPMVEVPSPESVNRLFLFENADFYQLEDILYLEKKCLPKEQK
jgi:serine/threonine protein kinase